MTNQPVTYDQLRKHRYVLFVLVGVSGDCGWYFCGARAVAAHVPD